MNNNIYSIQRTFKLWGFLMKLTEGPIFADEERGFAAVLENKFLTQQSEGYIPKGHIAMSKDDVHDLLASPVCNLNTSDGYMN